MLCPTEPPITPPEPVEVALCLGCGQYIHESEPAYRWPSRGPHELFCEQCAVDLRIDDDPEITCAPVEFLLAGYPPEPDNRADLAWERDE